MAISFVPYVTCGSRDPPGGADMPSSFSAPGFTDELTPGVLGRRDPPVADDFAARQSVPAAAPRGRR
ncbi:hypothetical protein ABZ543_27310 [Streptomyces roseifaciens]